MTHKGRPDALHLPDGSTGGGKWRSRTPMALFGRTDGGGLLVSWLTYIKPYIILQNSINNIPLSAKDDKKRKKQNFSKIIYIINGINHTFIL